MTRTVEISDETYEALKDQLGVENIKEVNSLDELVGDTFAFQCARYIYHGKVTNVTPTHIVLKDAAIVYDTGELTASQATDKQMLPQKTLFLMRQAIESFWKPKW